MSNKSGVDNSFKKRLERMADTITRLKNEIVAEQKKDKKDLSKILKLSATLKTTISNFTDLHHAEDMKSRLKKLGGSRKRAKRSSRKNTRRNHRRRI